MQMVVLLASAPLGHGSELFMDYRLNMDMDPSKIPTWYHPYDYGERKNDDKAKSNN